MRDEGPPGLRALIRVREQIARHREAELGRAASALALAEAVLAEEAERCRAGRERLEGERERPLGEQVSGADLQRAQLWQTRLATELTVLRAAEQTALEARSARRREHGAAQQALLAARAELKAVERAWQRWDQARRAAEERRAEEELADLNSARRRAR